MAERDDDEGRQIRPFASVLTEHDRGRFHDRVSRELADLTVAVTETGKKGAMVLTFTVEPLAKGAAGALKVSTKVAVKAPQPDNAEPASVFFADDDGNLMKEDPKQERMDIRVVAKKGEVA